MIYCLMKRFSGNIVFGIAAGFAVIVYIITNALFQSCGHMFPLYRAYFDLLGSTAFVLPPLILSLDCIVSYIICCKICGKLNVVSEMVIPLQLLTFYLFLLMFSSKPVTRFTLLLCDLPNVLQGHVITREINDLEVYTIREQLDTRHGNSYVDYHFASASGETFILSSRLEDEDFQRKVNDYMRDEQNGRPKELDEGTYAITYLPVSRCMLKISFIPK